MIESCVKMECVGCRKLIPTHLFYDHLLSNNQACLNSKNTRSPVLQLLLNHSVDGSMILPQGDNK